LEVDAIPTVSDEAVLTRLRDGLRVLYGTRLARALLFDPRARGDAQPDSDFDVAVFLHDFSNFWSELQPLGALTTDIMLETNAVISAKPFPADAYLDRTLFMQEVRRDGITL
jgi:uncharacterized protein